MASGATLNLMSLHTAIHDKLAEADAALERAEQKIEAFLNLDECDLVMGFFGLVGGAAIMFAAVTAVAVILFSLDPVKLP